MHTILGKQNLNKTVKRLDIKAENLIGKIKPGHFVGVMVDAHSRCLPFMVFEYDGRRKSLSIVFEENSPETEKMASLKINDPIFSLTGPYGRPCPVAKQGTVLCVGENLGLVSLVGLCKALKQTGNKVIGIAGFDSRQSSILENQMRLNCSKFHVVYKDGMHDRKGDVLGPFRKALADEQPVAIYVDASLQTQSEICRIGREAKIPVTVNLLELAKVCPSFMDDSHVVLTNERFYPAVDGVMVDSDLVDLREVQQIVTSAGEYSLRRIKDRERFDRSGGFARLKKLIWG